LTEIFFTLGGDSLISMWELADIESKRIGSGPALKSKHNPIELKHTPGTIQLYPSLATTLIREKPSL